MKVFILAIDGLEYNLVEKWKLNNLKQVTYGKGKCFVTREVPYTPTMWVSFITGKHPSEHGVDAWWSWGKFLDWIRLKTPLAKIKGKKKVFLPLLNFFRIKPRRLITRADWKKDLRTIFDVVRPSIGLFIPGYNESIEFHNFTEDMSIEEIERVALKNHEKRKRIMFKKIKEEWKLFMVWFDIVDLFGHMFWTLDPQKIKWCYREADSLAREIKKRIGDSILLIVSDHGMKLSDDGVTGYHSDHFFWSLNIKTSWRPRYITDFYEKILEWSAREES